MLSDNMVWQAAGHNSTVVSLIAISKGSAAIDVQDDTTDQYPASIDSVAHALTPVMADDVRRLSEPPECFEAMPRLRTKPFFLSLYDPIRPSQTLC
jgi:hypothetical protein